MLRRLCVALIQLNYSYKVHRVTTLARAGRYSMEVCQHPSKFFFDVHGHRRQQARFSDGGVLSLDGNVGHGYHGCGVKRLTLFVLYLEKGIGYLRSVPSLC